MHLFFRKQGSMTAVQLSDRYPFNRQRAALRICRRHKVRVISSIATPKSGT